MQDNNDILSNFSNKTAQNMANLSQSLNQNAQQNAQASQNSGDFITNDQIAADQAAKDAQAQQGQQPDPNAQTTPQAGQGDGNGGNWFTKALPTIGSIAAPILGALLAPETGGASLLAGLALASAGSGAGKLGENALEGKQDITNGVGGAALEGGVGQLVGGAAGKVLGGAAGAIGKVADQGIANAAEKTAAGAASDTANGISKIYDMSKSAAQDLRPGYGRGSLKLADQMGVDQLDPNAVHDAAQLGLQKIGGIRDEMLGRMTPINAAGVVDETGNIVQPGVRQQIASALSGKDPVTGEMLSAPRTNVMGSLDPINQRNIMDGSFVSSSAKGQQENASTNFLRDAQNALSGVIDKQNVSPSDFLEAQQRVGNLANKAWETANKTGDAVDMANAQAWQDLNKNLKNTLYSDPSVNDFLANTKGVLTAEDTGGNEQLANFLNDRINGLSKGQDLNDNLSQLIDLRDTGRAGIANLNDPGSAANKYLTELKSGAINADGTPIQIPTSKTGIVAGLANKVLGAVGNGGATSQVASKLADNLTGASAVAGKIASRVPEGITPNIASNYATNAGLLGTIGAQAVAGAPNYQGPAGTGNAVNTLQLGNPSTGNFVTDIMNSTSPAADAAKAELISSYFAPSGGAGSLMGSKAIGDFGTRQQNLANAESQVNSYIQALNAAGGAQGRIGGLLGELGGALTGGPAAALGNQKAALEQSLSTALGHPVSLPGMQMNQQAANSILAQLQGQLGTQTGF